MVYANAVNFRYKKREFRTFLVIPRNRVENLQKKTTPFCQSRHNLIAVLAERCYRFSDNSCHYSPKGVKSRFFDVFRQPFTALPCRIRAPPSEI